jgi:hypothetical protein
MITLGIDYGSSNIGIALVHNTASGENVPLFAGTIKVDARWLKDKVEIRAGIRRLRRTKKTKRRRIANLQKALADAGLAADQVRQVVSFSERRGYKSLFDRDVVKEDKESDLTYRFTREDFFKSLERELNVIIPEDVRQAKALAICENILNRRGDPFQEIRKIKIDNRGVSRCAWEGCSRVTPRSDNALREIIAQQLFTVFQTVLKDNLSYVHAVDKAASVLDELAKRLRHSAGEHATKEKKTLRKKARIILRELKEKLYRPDDYVLDQDRAWKYIETGILNIIEKRRGRNRYCRDHSNIYVETILSGKPAPFKHTINESDIISRREQIAYSKLWRYIEARVLPLATEGIDRIVVERTAFDLLAGSWKSIQTASDQFKEDMYQQGPMYGFGSLHEMLKEEFGGLCAYCGKPSDMLRDREHILPRAKFFFDSYLNLVPACPKCNSDLKGKRTLSELSLTIHPDAYKSYTDYLKKKFKTRPMHYLHTIKKGVLNLMQDHTRLWEAERYLSLIAKQFAKIVQSQRSPRPFARYLCSKLSAKQGKTPEMRFQSGRHTALYRDIAYPDFNKYAERRETGIPVNHAIDAMLLASDLPDLYPVESLNIPVERLQGWVNNVRLKAPKPSREGIPECPKGDIYVDGFENVHPSGYVEVEIRSMRWNQKDGMTHKQDPYGLSVKEQMPTKRVSALDLYGELKKDANLQKVKDKVDLIHHPGLRKAMAESIKSEISGLSAAEALKAWLRVSVKKSIMHSSFSNHPGDLARKNELEKFANQDDYPIPAVIGVKMFDVGVRGKVDLERIDKQTGGIGHRYMTQPPNRAVVVAYPKKKSGGADLGKPYCLYLRQNLSVIPEEAAIFAPPPSTLTEGSMIGKKGERIGNRRQMIEAYLINCGFHSYIYLTPACVIHYQDGKSWFLRNFDKSKDFKKGRLKNVSGVRRTPFVSRIIPLKTLT